MRKKIIKKIKYIVIFVIILSVLPDCSQDIYAKEQDEVHNVLILHSYHQGFTWTKEENDGIMDYLSSHGSNIIMYTEYLDWKNYPSEYNLDLLEQSFRFKYLNKNIDLIIATDDSALKFAINHRKELFSDAPIVFCGINQEGYSEIIRDIRRATGVIETIDPTRTYEIASELNPSVKNIYLIYDNSESGLSTGKIVTDRLLEKDPTLNIIPCNNMAYQDLLQLVANLTEENIVLITTYYSDVENHILDLEYVTREVSKYSSVPVYHLYDFGLNNGAIGGAMLSGRMQGELAASMALRILNGENIENVHVVAPQTIRLAFDYQQLERFELPLDRLPKECEIINQPFSFYRTYKTFVHSVIIAFAVLITFVCILLFYIRIIKRMKKNLSDSHEELTQLYEELAASEEEMKQQYDEILIINEKLRKGEENLLYLAYHDSLTGLPNKLSLYEDAKLIFNGDSKKSALYFIDIDNFKYINDTMGHDFGDQLIIEVGNRLSSLLPDNSILYRLSGDEFILIMENINASSEAEEFAKKILNHFTKEFDVLNSTLHVSLSIGIVLYPEHGHNVEHLLKYADIAMYQAKISGKKNYVIYNKEMIKAFTERVTIEKYLHNALDNNEFEVHYQPQFDIRRNRVTGLEALLRWNNPVLGRVPPLKFINIAEDTHCIIPIGNWVLEKACSFLKELQNKGYRDLTISVNISILQLLQTDFYDIVKNILKKYEIEPHLLELEITETVLIESFDTIVDKLEKLAKLKVRIALDDFGKGYSSLNYLKQLPINTLKVDKSFVDHITERDCNLLAGQIITIGKSMGMCVVAEGVEHQEQLEYLARHECDKIQGYLYSKPITETELIEFLEQSNR